MSEIIHWLKKGVVSSVEVRVLCQGGVWVGVSSSLIGQKCKMADGKQPSDLLPLWSLIAFN